MIETVLNLLFNCTHRHLTRPFTPVNVAHGETYVVCLDCGKQFAYDLNTMHIGKVIEQTSLRRARSPPAQKQTQISACWGRRATCGAARLKARRQNIEPRKEILSPGM
jgi:hypothetical protein